ncbi:HEAT repeat domain-containing protein [Niabella drilacis]|uniref:HEAT repeat-containing protein n=1 Tax=Niabella drilacis (strain DSM 25811 / CCM 8410 / CCUG 62505 / LMG 26954 / E90) TaxID=1285928 RepID=A0A1G6XMM5_NIADE|nr:HEAT repeat domain-containing protein [Niabella drilacis]SDD78597.1 HEAT repeat-containing protein [Niabella drilacis]
MKKDILKEFVVENRDDFDDQEPGSDVLGKIQSRLGLEQPVVVPGAKVIKFRYWWAAAAAIVVIIGVAALFHQKEAIDHSIVAHTAPVSVKPMMGAGKKDSVPVVQSMVAAIAEPVQRNAVVKKSRRIVAEKNTTPGIDAEAELAASNTVADDWRKGLQNESSSARLAAILASGKENAALSSSDLQTLSNTLNSDENSNVRLAALDVLKKQENRETVKELLLQSVSKQDDPVVQMELLASLSSGEATTIKQQLLDITQDPMNMDGVRNEAYAALLRSKSNF